MLLLARVALVECVADRNASRDVEGDPEISSERDKEREKANIRGDGRKRRGKGNTHKSTCETSSHTNDSFPSMVQPTRTQ